VGLVVRILVSEVGREIDSVRESERVAACAGVPVVRLKVIIFTIACGLVGIQGGLHAYFLKYIDPGSFTVVISLNFVVMNVIGGMEHLAGALIGTVFLVVLPELLRGYVELQHVFFGIILMIVMAAMPGGMVELVSQLRARRQRRLEKEEGL
jgi:branched-chain amino acid transport system permease protein